jgi:hypothetical protein
MLQIRKVVSIFKGWLKEDYNNSRPSTIVTIFEKKNYLLLKSQMNDCCGGRN